MQAPCIAILAAAIALPIVAREAGVKGEETPNKRDSYEVVEENAFVHEEPDTTSPIARRLFRGEVVTRINHIVADDGKVWIEIEMGEGRSGFILANNLDLAGRFPRGRWHKTVIIRDERPLAISARGMGETHGAALNIRYLPFTRFGMSFGLGPVIDEWAAHGTALTAGFLFFAGTRNLSPYFDVGVTRLSYHETRTKLQITALYVTCGLEWMASFGGFISAGITYIRSMDISITVKHDDATSGNYSFGSYGTLGDDIEDGELYQTVQPSFSIGYGF